MFVSRWDWPKHVALVAGVMVSALGVAVLVAWHLHFTPLIQVFPELAPMQRMTALGFLLSGAALAFAGKEWKPPAEVCALVVFVLAVLVCLEYALSAQFGIDELLGPDYINVRTPNPGRMSPVTALCFIGSSLALLVTSIRRLARLAPAVVGILASILLAVGTVSVLGYVLGRTETYGWRHFIGVALPTAAAFAVIGAGLLAWAWRESGAKKGAPRWLPLSIGMGLSAVTLGVWQALMAHEESKLMLLSLVTLAGGILGASLVAIAVYLAQEAQNRSRELQEGKTELERLFEATPDALLVTDRHGRIIRANHRVESILGYTPDELFGEPIERLVPEKTRGLRHQHREGYYSSPSTRSMEEGLDLRIRRKDGSELPVDISLSPLRSGSEMQVLAVVHDISERRRAQEALRQSEERFRGVFERSPLGLALIQPDFRLARVNPSLCRMSGYSEAELLAQNPFDLTHPDDLEKSRALAEQLFKGEIPFYQLEKRYVKKGGEIIWVNMTATILRDQEGRPLFGLGMAEDITERKRVEADLRLGNEIIANIEDGLCLVRSSDGTIVFANPKFEKMFGYSPGEMAGKHVTSVNAPTDKSPEEVAREIIGELLRHGVWRGEVLNRRKDGTPFLCAVTVSTFDHPGFGKVWVSIHRDITERKRIERKLAEQAALLDLAHDAIIGRDHAAKIIFWNRGAQDMYGWSAEEALGRVTHHLLQTRFPIPLREIEAAVLAQGRWQGELEHTTRDGKTIIVASHWSLRPDEPGAEWAILEINRDVTLSKRAEDELRALTQRLSLATRSASMGVWDWDLRTERAVWDDTMFEIYGAPKQPSVGREDWARPIHPDDRARAEAFLEKIIRGKTQDTLECRLIRPDGSLRHVSLAGAPALDDRGGVTRVVGVMVDVTKRKEAEEELRALSARLSQAAQFASMGVWEWDPATNRFVLDDIAFAMLGVPKVGRLEYEDFARLVPADDLPKLEATLQKVVREKTQQVVEFRVIRPDGVLRYAYAAGGAVLDQQGNVVRVVGIAFDITERKQIEAKLEDSREQMVASARLSALGMMAGGVAHEINNPLSIIHAMASDLEEIVEEKGAAPPPVVTRKSSIIRETAERIAKIVKSLRQISREGAHDPFHPTRLARILDETLEICRARFTAHGVKLLLPQAIPELSVVCREVQIEQALLNLLQNAFDAVAEKEGERWVKIEVGRYDDSVAISVIDNGPGIPPEIRARIMEPFFTTKEVGKGTGLGLSLSKTIAEEHGGKLEFGEDNGHTRFSLVLPLAAQAEAA